MAGQILVSQYRQLVTQAATPLAAHGAEASWLTFLQNDIINGVAFFAPV